MQTTVWDESILLSLCFVPSTVLSWGNTLIKLNKYSPYAHGTYSTTERTDINQITILMEGIFIYWGVKKSFWLIQHLNFIITRAACIMVEHVLHHCFKYWKKSAFKNKNEITMVQASKMKSVCCCGCGLRQVSALLKTWILEPCQTQRHHQLFSKQLSASSFQLQPYGLKVSPFT